MVDKYRKPKLESWEYQDTKDFLVAARLHDETVAEMLAPIATQKDTANEMQSCIVDLHRTMRENYRTMIHKVGRNIYPLILARDNLPDSDRADIGRQGLGGTYTLYMESGETRSVRPTPKAYEILKCLGHIPLGLFSIISPYFQNPKASAWVGELNSYNEKVQLAGEALQHCHEGIDPDLRLLAKTMLDKTQKYVQHTVEKRSVRVEDYEHYCQTMRQHIRDAMDEAARIQVSAVTSAMLEWRDMLGPALWKRVYVVIPAVWPVAEHSPRWQIFRSIMDPESVDTHLLVAEGVNDEEEARTLAGRIVADRLAGRLVFGTDDERGQRMTQCLSSPTDVVSDSCYRALREFGEGGPFKKE